MQRVLIGAYFVLVILLLVAFAYFTFFDAPPL